MINQISRISRARLAGALYLIVVLTGIFSLMYVPYQLFTDMPFSNTIASAKAKLCSGGA